MSMTYGKTEPTYFTDPDVVAILVHGTRTGKLAQVGGHIVDNYPILRYVPFVTKTLREWHQEELVLFGSLVEGVRKKMVSPHPISFTQADLQPLTQCFIYTGRPCGTAMLRDLSTGASAGVRTDRRRARVPCRLYVWGRFGHGQLWSLILTRTLIRCLVSQSASAISFVIMAAARFPKEAAKVQEQLDAVVGADRRECYVFYSR